jgi:peptidoglycan/LPS O-acetylase OafA/YrhL
LSNLKYRADIDGLRAVAVLSVIIFHINAMWLPGGFLGVDIFFVISGYLITTIIHQKITDNCFSFAEFYSHRMKRILPAFFTVIVSCLLVGYFLLLPNSFNDLGKSAFSTLFFASNVYFSKAAGGYFAANDTLPLLHTWSLAVEEQYYFVWPIILITLLKCKISPSGLIKSMIIVAVISFTGATYLAVVDTPLAPWNYYMLPSRAGELLVGSILAVQLNNGRALRNNKYWGIIGSLFIILSFILVNGHSIFPGINALWACLGTAFIIYSKPNNLINRALSIKQLTYIGRISYSLYLWHWPVLAFMRYIDPNNQQQHAFSALEVLFIIALTWLLAHLTYLLVECKTRTTKMNFTKTFVFYLTVPSTVVFIAFLILYKSNGMPLRFGDNGAELTYHTPNGICSTTKERGCKLTSGKDNLTIALVGDSHAQFFESFMLLLGQENNITVKDYASQNCAPAKPTSLMASAGPSCEKARKALNKNIKTTDVVIIVARWEWSFFTTFDNKVNGAVDDYYNKLKNEIIKLKAQGIKKVILVKQVPKYKQDLKKSLLPMHNELNYEIDGLYQQANNEITQIAKETGSFIIDFTPIFCNEKVCSPFDDQGTTLYYDNNHLNVHGAKWLYKQFQASQKHIDVLNYIKS